MPEILRRIFGRGSDARKDAGSQQKSSRGRQSVQTYSPAPAPPIDPESNSKRLVRLMNTTPWPQGFRQSIRQIFKQGIDPDYRINGMSTFEYILYDLLQRYAIPDQVLADRQILSKIITPQNAKKPFSAPRPRDENGRDPLYFIIALKSNYHSYPPVYARPFVDELLRKGADINKELRDDFTYAQHDLKARRLLFYPLFAILRHVSNKYSATYNVDQLVELINHLYHQGARLTMVDVESLCSFKESKIRDDIQSISDDDKKLLRCFNDMIKKNKRSIQQSIQRQQTIRKKLRDGSDQGDRFDHRQHQEQRSRIFG